MISRLHNAKYYKGTFLEKQKFMEVEKEYMEVRE